MSGSLARLFPNLRGTHEAGCLSLYLAAGPGWDPSYYSALLKDLGRNLESAEYEPEADRVRAEMNRVERFIAEVRPPGLPLAVFSSSADELFEAFRLPDDVASRGFFGRRFELGPLERQLEEHPPGLVVVAAKDHTSLYAVVLEDVHELAEYEGRFVSDSRRSRPSSSHRATSHDVHLNLKQAVDLVLGSRLERLGLEAIYLAGPVEARSAFKSRLPKAARERVVSELEVNPSVTPAELANRIRELT